MNRSIRAAHSNHQADFRIHLHHLHPGSLAAEARSGKAAKMMLKELSSAWSLCNKREEDEHEAQK